MSDPRGTRKAGQVSSGRSSILQGRPLPPLAKGTNETAQEHPP